MNRTINMLLRTVAPPITENLTGKSILMSQESLKREHDHVSNSINASLKGLVAVFLYCAFTIILDFGGEASERIKVPLAGVEVSYTGFSVFSLLIIITLLVSLHLKISYWRSIGGSESKIEVGRLPYFFNRQGLGVEIQRALAFYWLPIVVIIGFMVNVIFGERGNFWGQHPLRNIFVFYTVGPVAVCCLLYFQILRASPRMKNIRLVLWVPILAFAYLPANFLIESIAVAIDPNSYYDWE